MFTIIQHEKSTPAGSTQEWLNNRPFKLVQLWKGDRLPSTSEVTSLVICGGHMNVDEESKWPWMKEEKKLIQSCVQSKIPTLGLCLGGQLMAEALGAKVYRHSITEVGWHGVKLSFSDELSPLNTTSDLKVFQYHSYRFELPKGSLRVATNSNCEDQGFSLGSHCVGLQFHPESTKEWVLDCLNERYPNGPAVQDKEAVRKDMYLQDHLQAWYFQLLDFVFTNKAPK